MKFVAALALLLVSSIACAGELAYAWRAPITNTDSSPIPATGPGSITTYRIEYGTCVTGAFGTKLGEISVNAPTLAHTFQNIAPGTYCGRVYARNTYANESLASNVGVKTIAAPTPNPPVLVATDTQAYEIKGTTTLTATRVGLVPLGTACGTESRKVGTVTYNRLPRSAVDMVNWPANVKITDVWGKCS